MVKIRHISSLLVLMLLLLLVINCDLKSQREGIVQKNSYFRRIFTGERALRKSGKGVALTGVDSVVEQRQPSEVVALTGVDKSVPKLTEEEKSLGIKPNNPLDKIWLLDKEREAVDYIQSVVTDANIGSDKGYKTYTDLEFYNLLNELGDVKLKKIIKVHLGILQEQEKASNAILNVPSYINKQELQNRFNKHKDNYNSYLKGLFNRTTADDVYNNIIINNYNIEFNDIKEKVEGLIEVGHVYAELSDEEKSVIDGMQVIVTDENLAKSRGYMSYSDISFDNLLDNLGLLKVREMISAHLNNLKAQDEASSRAKVAIESVETPKISRRLKYLFSDYKRSYPEHLIFLFYGKDPNLVYNKVVKDLYAKNFAELETHANLIIQYEKFYKEFSDSRKNAVNEIRKILTDPKIRSPKDSGEVYRGFDFEILLGMLGAEKVGEMMDFYLKIKEAEEGVRNALKNAKEGTNKESLQAVFDNQVRLYPFNVQIVFHRPFSDPNKVYLDFIGNNYMVVYASLKTAADLLRAR
ncbi:BTA121 domain-containing protein surface lipoprotein [Borrelia turicatae]|uniref:BTA121 domain-containing protein surface lipoprotein n=1 Tax=Borrelia turicatae TaxID=142 RepID=UPI002ED539C6